MYDSNRFENSVFLMEIFIFLKPTYIGPELEFTLHIRTTLVLTRLDPRERFVWRNNFVCIPSTGLNIYGNERRVTARYLSKYSIILTNTWLKRISRVH